MIHFKNKSMIAFTHQLNIKFRVLHLRFGKTNKEKGLFFVELPSCGQQKNNNLNLCWKWRKTGDVHQVVLLLFYSVWSVSSNKNIFTRYRFIHSEIFIYPMQKLLFSSYFYLLDIRLDIKQHTRDGMYILQYYKLMQ